MRWSVKETLAALALAVASLLAIWALLLPPQGEIDQSVLFSIAQFLVFSATLLGVDGAMDRMKALLRNKDREGRDKEGSDDKQTHDE